MSQEIKDPPQKPRDIIPWTPIPELARWERAMEQMFGETSKKKPAAQKTPRPGDLSKTGDSGAA
jgi:hypothetical protein